MFSSLWKKIDGSFLGFVGLLILIFPLALQAEVSNNPATPAAPRQVIVKLNTEYDPSPEFRQHYNVRSVERIVQQHRFSERKRRSIEEQGVNRLYTLEIENAADLAQTVARLNRDPAVEYAEPNYQVRSLVQPNDPSFSQLWGLHNTGQTGGQADADIDAVEVWESQSAAPVTVGVIDSGIDVAHEDLAANIWHNPGEIAGNGIDDDHNGFVDDIHGWDFVSNDNDPQDDHGHGTHVAGTIGAVGNNGRGVVGVNWSVRLAALKFLDKNGSGYVDDAIAALQYANLMDFKVTNHSWGGGGYSQALFDAIAAANDEGSLFVAAAGNDGRKKATYPAAYALPNVISVGASDHMDRLASFSNYSTSLVDLAAPGVNIFSTVPTGTCAMCHASRYASASGTSMAAPHVTGGVSLLWAHNPLLTHVAVKNALLTSVDVVSSLDGKVATSGRLNINGALRGPTPTPTPAPSPTTLLADSFEVAEWNDLWTEDVQNDWGRSTQRKVGSGRRSAEVDGGAVDAQLVSRLIDVQGTTTATISFSWFIESGLDGGEYLAFDVSTDGGATWVEKARLRGNQDPENSWRPVTVTVAGNDTLRIRFRGTMNDASEDANVDALVVTAY